MFGVSMWFKDLYSQLYFIYVSQLHQAAEIQVPAGDPDVKNCSTVAPGTAVQSKMYPLDQL